MKHRRDPWYNQHSQQLSMDALTTPDRPALDDSRRIQCTGCPVKLTEAELGRRRDGKVNTRCPRCRATQASSAGRLGSIKARSEQQRDIKALRVVERYVGMNRDLWTTPAGKKAQERFLIERQGFDERDLFHLRVRPFEELWTARMRRLASRAAACRAARSRIAKRNATPTAEAA